MVYLRHEMGYEKVFELLTGAQARNPSLYLCLVNYGELLYINKRFGGRLAAEETIRIIDSLPLEVI